MEEKLQKFLLLRFQAVEWKKELMKNRSINFPHLYGVEKIEFPDICLGRDLKNRNQIICNVVMNSDEQSIDNDIVKYSI